MIHGCSVDLHFELDYGTKTNKQHQKKISGNELPIVFQTKKKILWNMEIKCTLYNIMSKGDHLKLLP